MNITKENLKKYSGKIILGLCIVIALAAIMYGIVDSNKGSNSSSSYLSDIVYKKKDTNKNLQVVINLKGNPMDDKLTATFKNKKLKVDEASDLYYFIAKENGTYSIKYGKFTKEIKITNIDKESPELKSINKDGDLLTFTVNDTGSGVNTKKSYVQTGDKKVELIDSGEGIIVPKEAIKEDSTLYLYDKAGNVGIYNIKTEKI